MLGSCALPCAPRSELAGQLQLPRDGVLCQAQSAVTWTRCVHFLPISPVTGISSPCGGEPCTGHLPVPLLVGVSLSICVAHTQYCQAAVPTRSRRTGSAPISLEGASRGSSASRRGSSRVPSFPHSLALLFTHLTRVSPRSFLISGE